MKWKKVEKLLAFATAMVMAFAFIGCGEAEPATESAIPEVDVMQEDMTENTEVATATGDALAKTGAETEPAEDDGSETEAAAYTFTEMDTRMYAKSSVNVRDFPSSDGNRLGSLNRNQEVKVTGKCNETGWYRIEFNEEVAYVSDSYLVTDKLAEAENGGKDKGQDTLTPANVTDTTSTTATQQEAHYDRDKAIAVFNLVNAERAASGLSQLTWDESSYEYSCRRARDITFEFSHYGNDSSIYGENILWSSRTESAESIHNTWHNSPGHYANYMSANYGSISVAVLIAENGATYAVESFKIAESAKQPWEIVVETWTASNGVVVTKYQNGDTGCSGVPGQTLEDLDIALAEYEACH